MKAGWQSRPLADVLVKTETVNPTLKPKTEFEYIDVSSVSNATFTIEQTQTLMGKDAPSRARKLVRANDVLFATIRPTLQRIAVVPEELDQQVCSTGYIVLRPTEALNHRYLYYYLFTDGFMDAMQTLQKGASYPAVTDGEVKAQQIAYPPLPEQHRIVSILDQAFEGIATATANAERNLRNAREVFEGHRLTQIGTFRSLPHEKLGEVAVVQSGGTPLVSNKAFWSGTIPWYSSGELNDLHTTDPERFITEAGLAGSNAKLFPKGSLLIGMYDTAALKMSLLDRAGTFNQAIAGVKPHPKLNMEFVLHYINALKPDILALRRGVRQKNLSLGKIQDISIHVPEISVQSTVVERLNELSEETSRLEALYQQKLDTLTELKKSILHQAFTGQLH